MKWARLVDDPDRAAKKQSDDDKKSVLYISEKELREFQTWITYKFSKPYPITALSKREYEMVIGGYLMYYDERVRSGLTDHHLYVRWAPHDQGRYDGKSPRLYDSVTLLLSPPALRKIKSKADITAAGNQDHTHDLARGQHLGSVATPAPSPDLQVDPPPPPPPPPPSLDDQNSDLVP